MEEAEGRLSALETRIAELERVSKTFDTYDKENADIDEKIRGFYVILRSIGVVLKWVVYVLAAVAGTLAAYNAIVKEALGLLSGT